MPVVPSCGQDIFLRAISVLKKNLKPGPAQQEVESMAKGEASSNPTKADVSSNTAKGEGSPVVKKPDKSGLGKPLYQPKDGEPSVDIVFVHGINGDRIDTWTCGDKMWPRDFLPEILPEARIVSFGYNADFAKFYHEDHKSIAPELTIDDYSISLLDSVRALRKGKEAERPIIFVAHSMGGLVVANALSRDLKADKALQSIPDHTIGALFLGTPFQGSSLASYGSVAMTLLKHVCGVRTQLDSLETLKKKSKKLVDINTKFAKFVKERDRAHSLPFLQIACFFEGIPFACNAFVVPRESATWLGVDPLYIDANHTEMCQFDYKERDGYQKVSGKLAQWINEYDARKTASGGGGLNAHGINQSGNVNYESAHISQSIATGHVAATTPDAVQMTLCSETEFISMHLTITNNQ
ncbi:hypothetical protein diail_5932 [Diaporthe ilicicola]|nr:hypothetical protein diail_5932 [Diaporthe ilicicola]